jgi:DNA-binding transcriptional ArsR family regulator
MAERGRVSFDPRDLERVFQAPARLRIMAALVARGEMDFNELLDLFKLTRGNLSVHMKVLDECGFVETVKTFLNNRPHTTYRLREKGRLGFEQHVSILENIIASAKQGGVAHDAS